MIIDITDLNSEDYKEIDEVYSFSKEELKNTDILKLDNVSIKGDITKNSLGELLLNIIVKGTMILPCAVSLKPVNYDFEVEIDENLTEYSEENYKICKNNQKTLDILPIIWENILMEIPMRVVSDDLSGVITKGDGWELVTEEKKVNPSLAKLKDLL